MKIVLLGAGLQAQAIAADIINHHSAELLIGDVDLAAAEALAAKLKKQFGKGAADRTSVMQVDVTKAVQLRKTLKGATCTIGATTYAHNLILTEAAIAAGSHFCDLGGNVNMVKKQHALSSAAKKAGVTIIPDCGLAPGMATVLSHHWVQEFDSVESLQIRVGGLPQEPQTALNYQLTFAVEGLINEYVEDGEILRDGKHQWVKGMSGLETLSFPRPYGKLEAFYTSGGTSTLPKTLRGKVKNLDYKTIRYPGHAQYAKFLLELGLFSSDPVLLPGHKNAVVPRALTGKLLDDYLPDNQPDVVLVRIAIDGVLAGKRQRTRYDLIDLFDPESNLTAMQRTTGFPVAIIAQMLSDGRAHGKGTRQQEKAIDGAAFVEALKKRNIRFKKSVRAS